MSRIRKCIASVSLLSLLIVGASAVPALAVPTYNSYTANAAGGWNGGINHITINAPSHSAGDMMIAIVTIGNTGSATAPSGWTELLYTNGLSGPQYVFTKNATASEPSSYTFTVSSAKGASMAIVDYTSGGSTVYANYYSSAITCWNQTSPYTATIPGIATGTGSTTLVTAVVARMAGGVVNFGYDTLSFPSNETVEFSYSEAFATGMTNGFIDLYEFGDEMLSGGNSGNRSITEVFTPTNGSPMQTAKGYGFLIALSD